MKRFLRIFAIAAICGILVVPSVDAQSRNGGRGHAPSSPSRPGSAPQSRPAPNPGNRPTTNPGNNGSNSGHRPGSNPGNNTKPAPNPGNRPTPNPGNNGNNGGHRPGSNPGNNTKPAPNPGNRPTPNPGNNGNNGGHRPGNTPPAPHPGNNGGMRPGNTGGYRPGNYRPGPATGNRPGIPGRPVHSVPPPHRPHYTTAWVAPRPPRGWRPGRVYPTFSTILGITFGTAINNSLNYLFNNGYTVYSYGNNAVYLSNVNQLNLLWPDATLYYGASGLDRGEFVYSTSYYDTVRYNDAYARLVAAYGAPVSTSYPSNGMQTFWFGNDGRFVTLQYMPMYGADGVQRYYTTLSFGL
ncbi:MAG: hypothetical protein HDS61_05045 [Barnesiella sp.]|nr:hypothetical protein [Barnesiella sp.]